MLILRLQHLINGGIRTSHNQDKRQAYSRVHIFVKCECIWQPNKPVPHKHNHSALTGGIWNKDSLFNTLFLSIAFLSHILFSFCFIFSIAIVLPMHPLHVWTLDSYYLSCIYVLESLKKSEIKDTESDLLLFFFRWENQTSPILFSVLLHPVVLASWWRYYFTAGSFIFSSLPCFSRMLSL